MRSFKPITRPIPSLPRLPVIARGTTGWVFKINDRIVLKMSLTYNSLAMTYENKVYEILEAEPPNPYILQSIFRQPGINFLPFMSGGSLDKRIKASQKRDRNNKIASIIKLEDPRTVRKWAKHLTAAVAWLEEGGLVHGDLRPRNMLLDADDNLKLADFDRVAEMGMNIVGTRCPWTRLFGSGTDDVLDDEADEGAAADGEANLEDGPWGVHSAKTEQFTVGSVLYFASKGHEPYEDVGGTTNRTRLWRSGVFPPLDDSGMDVVINACWKGAYCRLQHLSDHFADEPEGRCIGMMEMAELRGLCEYIAADLE